MLTVILGIVLFGILLCFMLTRNYHKKFLNGLLQEEIGVNFTTFFSLALFIIDKTGLRQIVLKNDKLKEETRQVYMGLKPSDAILLFYCKKIQAGIVVLLIFCFMAFFGALKEQGEEMLQNGYEIEREEYGQGSKSFQVEVTADEADFKTDMNLLIEERSYTEAEIEEQIKNCKTYLEKTYLGENESSEEIRRPLHLKKQMPGSPIKIVWKSDRTDIVEEDGRLHNENITETVMVGLTARLTYLEQKEEYNFYVKVLPKTYTKEEQMKKSIEDLVQKSLKESESEKKVSLPKKSGEYTLLYHLETTKSSAVLIILGVFSSVAAACMDQGLKKQGKMREQQILMDYPDIMNKFTLLLTAGMTVKGAWGKIAEDYKRQRNARKKRRFAYEEMLFTWNEISNQVTETKAYEAFGKRMKVLPYLRFSSLLTQNVKKGSAGLLSLLELEAVEAFEERKELAKRLGEEAGTKLLIPMVIMLLLVFLIIMLPAFQSLV